MIQPCIIYSNQDAVHSQEEAQQQEEAGGHHPLHGDTHTPTHCVNTALTLRNDSPLQKAEAKSELNITGFSQIYG